MNKDMLINVLNSVYHQEITVDKAFDKIKNLYSENIGFAHIDHHRAIRKGFPEVIFGESKTYEQILEIMSKMAIQESVILVTRIQKEKAQKIILNFSNSPKPDYHEDANMLTWTKNKIEKKNKGLILILSAGTSDIPVAKEAYLTALYMGNEVETVFDVGVAGIHRLFEYKNLIEKASVLIVVAGMEGALPSVVAGMFAKPVIAVPTSIGYGVSLGGLTALFAMLNSCSSNVAVVNIDNGFGAGYMASMINNLDK